MPKDDDAISIDDLTVAELKIRLADFGLKRSGKKSELVERLQTALDDADNNPTDDVPDQDDGLILADDEPEGGSEDSESTAGEPLEAEVMEADVIEAEVLEAEVMEADIVDERPRPKKRRAENRRTFTDHESPRPPSEDSEAAAPPEDDDEISSSPDIEDGDQAIVSTRSRISSLVRNPATIAIALTFALLLVGAGWFQWMQGAQSFSAEPLRYGDTMSFTMTDGTIEAIGEDMVALIRDQAGNTLEDACGDLSLSLSGTGQISVRKGNAGDIAFPTDRQYVGAVEAHDAYGRILLAAEQTLSYDLLVDLDGRTWSTVDPSKCGSMSWSLERNQLVASITSSTELTERMVLRTESDVSFTTAEGVSSELQAVTYAGTGISAFDDLMPLLLRPASPLPLYDFFGLTVFEEGMTGETDDWVWSVGADIKRNGDRVVPVNLDHKEVGECLGHARMSLMLREGTPWPVEQTVDILLSKDRKSTECGYLMSTAMDLSFPDGQLRIAYRMTETSSASGERLIDWNQIYSSRPGVGSDIPDDSDRERWVHHAPDNSTLRPYTLEEAVECAQHNATPNGVRSNIDEGGYLYHAASESGSESIWNMTWIDQGGDAGWVRLRDDGGGNCTVLDDVRLPSDESPSPNRAAIPDTLPISDLEQRIVSVSRYPSLAPLVANGGDWRDDVTISVHLTVANDSGLLDLLPDDIRAGKVTLSGSREWSEGGKDIETTFLMDAETARMVGWMQVRHD